MRGITGALMLVILLAAAIVIYLNGRSAKSNLEAVDHAATKLRTGAVEAKPFDRNGAGRTIRTLEMYLEDPSSIAGGGRDLEVISQRAAAWAEGAATGSAELHVAVSIRAAADELRAYGSDGRESHLQRARFRLDAAKRSLAGAPAVRGTMGGLRDRLDNVQQSQQEQLQELNDALK